MSQAGWALISALPERLPRPLPLLHPLLDVSQFLRNVQLQGLRPCRHIVGRLELPLVRLDLVADDVFKGFVQPVFDLGAGRVLRGHEEHPLLIPALAVVDEAVGVDLVPSVVVNTAKPKRLN